MEDIVKALSCLSSESLRQQLQNYGESVGPITSTTKKLFVKKLARRIFEERNPESVTDVSSDEQTGQHNAAAQCPSEIQSNDGSSAICTVFYGISLPSDLTDTSSIKDKGCPLVFTDKSTALKTLKTYKGSRFKTFKSRLEAEQFSKSDIDLFSSPLKLSAADVSTTSSAEAMAFRGPKMPELVVMRKLIEKGEIKAFEETVWNNPRYLVSSGDTPVILQEGFRYNALHVAAKSNQPEMCHAIINVIENRQFMKTLYPMDSEQTCSNRIHFLTDLYLNMPDKGFCESPLHFASKFGFVEVVQVFASHPSTDRFLLNKHGESPEQVACTRCDHSSLDKKERIKELLQDCCFVPLLRSEDNCTQAVIGEPWSPDTAQRSITSPVCQPNSPMDPQLVVRAYAGPMSPSMADTFHRRWTTPPTSSPDHVKRRLSEIKREDCDKGVERIGRKLSQDLNVPWMEYWDFLKAYVDLRSTKGLAMLDNYLQKQYKVYFPEESSLDKGRLLEKNLKNTHLKERDSDSPKILDFSKECEVHEHGAPGQNDGLARLDLSCKFNSDSTASNMSSESSSSSESNYSSCTSGSSDDSAKFQNSMDSFHSEQTSPSQKETRTENHIDTETNQMSPYSGGDYSCPMDSTPSVPGAFTSYRCTRSSSTDMDNSIDKSLETPSDQQLPCLEGTARINEDPQNNESTDSLDNMISALTEDIQNKLTISWALQDSNKGDTWSFAAIADSDKHSNMNDSRSLAAIGKSVKQPSCVQKYENHQSLKTESDFSVLHSPMKQDGGLSKSTPEDMGRCLGSPETPRCKEPFSMSTPVSSTSHRTTLHNSCQTPDQRLPSEASRRPTGVFIQGQQACKIDVDVLRAIEDVPVDPEHYPHISKWKRLVTSFDEDTRQSWPTPARLRARQSGTKSPQWTSSPMSRRYPQSPLASPGVRMALPRFNLLEELHRSGDNQA